MSQIRIETASISLLKNYSDHLKNLPEQDKIFRFGYKANDYAIDKLMLNIAYDQNNHKLWVAKNNQGTIVGWGHMAAEGSTWELALSVDHDKQNTGIGSKLIREMLAWAKVNHIDEVFMHCIEDNKTIQHLATKFGLKTRDRSPGERTAAIEVPAPNLFEVNTHLWKEHSEIMHEYSELRKRLTNLWFSQFTH